ncbi:MAG: glycosyltransferase family 39 protein [Chthonomonadales bacterium]|nr:glycosyltransferase family 39 protein [Chthonomonadales bacterium]
MARRSRPEASLPTPATAPAGKAAPPYDRAFAAALAALTLAALAVRLWGIGWGLPGPTRLFSYHPDEGVNLVQGVLDNGVARPHLHLGLYNYGGLFFYLWQAGVAVNGAYGLVSLPDALHPAQASPNSIAAMVMVGRLLSALLGALTALLTGIVGARLYGRRVGIGAAAFVAAAPLLVVHSHFATVDIPATFFTTAALATGIRLLEVRDARWCLAAGFLCGLAAATKYTAVVVLAAPLTALVLPLARRAERATPSPSARVPGVLAAVALVLAAAAAGFAFGCPGALLDWPAFVRDASFEARKSAQGMGLLFVGTGNGWLYHLRSSLRYGLGAPLLALSLGGVAWAVVRRARGDIYLAAFAAPYYLLIGYANVRFMRYVAPLCPVLAILAARVLLGADWRLRRSRRWMVVAAALFAGATLFISLALDAVMAAEDPRDRARAYILDRAPAGTSIALASTPWFWTPPLAPEFTAPSPAARRRAALESRQYRFRLPAEGAEWDERVFEPTPPDLVLLSDLETQSAMRLHYPPAMRFADHLNPGYRATVWENVPSLLGISIGKPPNLPIDLLYICPRVTLYARDQ